MKFLKIHYHPKLETASSKDASYFFEQNNTFEYIDMLNWPTQFPYKPDCRFKIARSNESLFIHFKITEKNIHAWYANDHDPVWKDSCVEFFCQLPDQLSYFNFEFNCIGTCLASKRDSRTDNIIPFTTEEISSIKRYASLGNAPFDTRPGVSEWKLTVEIPFSLIGFISGELPETINANFYKCADESSVPHYLSWNLITTPKPDFHCPAFFGKLFICE
ncbi:MAG: carbohydrate-binding family 9-like protein [Paludibacter sp.]|nr:carbohydrate-binding family 9-like protein [Paludibacter sp.]